MRFLRLLAVSWGIGLSFLLVFSFFGAYSGLADSISHFRLHLVLALVPAAGLLIAFKATKAAGIAVVVLMGSLAGIYPALPLGMAKAAPGQTSLRLLQLNLFYWTYDLSKFVDLVETIEPDVITLQEITASNRESIEPLLAAYPHAMICKIDTLESIAVLSRMPMDREGAGCIADARVAWVHIDVGGQPVGVATTHLTWPYPYDQHLQKERLKPVLASLPGPVILAGDFNAAPWSHTVLDVARSMDGRIASGLRTTFRLGDSPLGRLAGLPIDHVMASKGLTFAEVSVGPSVGSDHRPLLADILLPIPE